MESASVNISKMHILRVDPGEDVLHSVEAFLQEQGIRQAIVVGGYGTLAAYRLHWVAHNRLPGEIVSEKGEGGIEILSMNGLVVDGKPHIHTALATREQAFGGHLEEGCTAYVLCEIFFAEIDGAHLVQNRVAVDVPGMGKGEVPRLVFN